MYQCKRRSSVTVIIGNSSDAVNTIILLSTLFSTCHRPLQFGKKVTVVNCNGCFASSWYSSIRNGLFPSSILHQPLCRRRPMSFSYSSKTSIVYLLHLIIVSFFQYINWHFCTSVFFYVGNIIRFNGTFININGGLQLVPCMSCLP